MNLNSTAGSRRAIRSGQSRRGQVIEYENRPWPIVPSLPMFMRETEALHIHGFSMLQIHEASVRNGQVSTDVDVGIRVYRFQTDFSTDERKWARPTPYANTPNITTRSQAELDSRSV